MNLLSKIVDDLISTQETIIYSWVDIFDGVASQRIAIKITIESSVNKFFNVTEKTLKAPLSSLKQDFLTVTSNGFPGYRQFVGIANYGKDLQVSHFCTINSGIFREIFDNKLKGELTSRQILIIIDLISWITFVDHTIQRSLNEYIPDRQKKKVTNPITIKDFKSDIYGLRG